MNTDLKEVHPDEDTKDILVCFAKNPLVLLHIQLSGRKLIWLLI